MGQPTLFCDEIDTNLHTCSLCQRPMRKEADDATCLIAVRVPDVRREFSPLLCRLGQKSIIVAGLRPDKNLESILSHTFVQRLALRRQCAPCGPLWSLCAWRLSCAACCMALVTLMFWQCLHRISHLMPKPRCSADLSALTRYQP